MENNVDKNIQKYRKAWEKEPIFKKWLRPTKDTTKAACLYCRTEIVARYNDLVRHSRTKKHIKSMKPFGDVPVKQTEISFTVKEASQMQKSQGRLCLYVAVHSSFLAVNHLAEVCKLEFSDSKAANFSLHRTKCANIVNNILAPHFIEKLLTDIMEVPYSLILDEGTDISTEKLLGVIIRYYSYTKKKFITTFLGLIDLGAGTADAILEGLERLMNKFNISLENLIAIGTDNASNMTGVHNGLFQKIKSKYGLENLVLVRCVCHSLQLAVCAATSEHLPNNLEFLISETYKWFSNSSIRQKAYSKIFKLINSDDLDPYKIPRVSDTRWMSIEKAVKRILGMWLELKVHFNVVYEKKKEYILSLLRNMYNDQTNFIYLTYLCSVLAEVQRVNLAFEADNADQVKLHSDLFRLIKSLTNKIILQTECFNYLEDPIENCLDEFCYLGHSFEKACKDSQMSEDVKKEIKEKCVIFTKNLIYEIRCKLPTNFETLQSISLFSVNNILYNNNRNELVEFIKSYISDADIISNVEISIDNIKNCEWRNKERTDNFWIEVDEFKDSIGKNPFNYLSEFVIKLLSFPYSNAEVERAFSAMNLYKSKIRNRLSLNSVNSILHIKYGLRRENVCCDKYDLPSNVCKKISTQEVYAKSKYFLQTVLWQNDESDADISTAYESICLTDEHNLI